MKFSKPKTIKPKATVMIGTPTYTGDLVAVIWVGNANNSRTRNLTGGSMPASAFGNLMANIYDGRRPAAPPGVR